MSRFFLFRAYQATNTKYPAITQICTTATLLAAGDVIAQKTIEKKDSIDYARTARFFFIGIIYVGPGLKIWFSRLDRLIPHDTKLRAAKMVLVDQGLFAPCFIPGFLAVNGAVNQLPFSDIVDMVKRDTFPIVLTNWMVWPATQWINFNYVPLPYRVLFASGVALFWNIYISWVANKGLDKAKSASTAELEEHEE